jgi:hypothetical protein
MRSLTKAVIALSGALAGLAIATSGVLGCTSLATLTPSTPSGDPGSTVTITGHAFDPASNPVVLHWNSAQGPVLGTAQPDASGDIAVTVTIPKDAETGYYVIIGSQTDKTGAPVFGTPARMSFQVGTPAASTAHGNNNPTSGAVSTPVAVAPNTSPASQSSTGWLAAIAVLGVLGVGLFIVGLGFFLREMRRSEAVAIAR